MLINFKGPHEAQSTTTPIFPLETTMEIVDSTTPLRRNSTPQKHNHSPTKADMTKVIMLINSPTPTYYR